MQYLTTCETESYCGYVRSFVQTAIFFFFFYAEGSAEGRLFARCTVGKFPGFYPGFDFLGP
jgi:hypothetical protein